MWGKSSLAASIFHQWQLQQKQGKVLVSTPNSAMAGAVCEASCLFLLVLQRQNKVVAGGPEK